MKGKDLKIKVCGMKLQDNLKLVEALGVDFIGNIFFEKSPRNLETVLNVKSTKVGVFVGEEVTEIKRLLDKHALEVIQLHGGESNEICLKLKALGLQVWKVFSVDADFDFSELQNYPAADLFLFDTKSPKHGGTGRKFDWSILDRIDQESPKNYFLSGGIGPDDAKEIKALNLQKLVGLDLNSKFEINPGEKDPELLKRFLTELRNEL